MPRPAAWIGRLPVAALLAVAGLVALPGTGHAAQPFGSPLGQPAVAADSDCASTCTFGQVTVQAGGIPLAAPADGVITSYRLASGTTGVPVQLVVLRRSGATGTSGATGPATQVAAGAQGLTAAPSATIATQTSVRKGDELGLLAPPGAMVFGRGPINVEREVSSVFSPPLVTGQTATPVDTFDHELLLQATLEPDADGDGLGDETQDACPSQPSGPGAGCVVPSGPSGPPPGPSGPSGPSEPPPHLRIQLPGKRPLVRDDRDLTVKLDCQACTTPSVTVSLRGHGAPITKTVANVGAAPVKVRLTVPQGAAPGRYAVSASTPDYPHPPTVIKPGRVVNVEPPVPTVAITAPVSVQLGEVATYQVHIKAPGMTIASGSIEVRADLVQHYVVGQPVTYVPKPLKTRVSSLSHDGRFTLSLPADAARGAVLGHYRIQVEVRTTFAFGGSGHHTDVVSAHVHRLRVFPAPRPTSSVPDRPTGHVPPHRPPRSTRPPD